MSDQYLPPIKVKPNNVIVNNTKSLVLLSRANYLYIKPYLLMEEKARSTSASSSFVRGRKGSLGTS